MNFRVFGPFEIPVKEGEHLSHIESADVRLFWEESVKPTDLQESCGVYIFCVEGVDGKRKDAGKNLVWYVGKAERQTFRGECFNGKNMNLYNQILNGNYKGEGTPKMFFIVRHDKYNYFSDKATNEEEYRGLRFLEKIFIQYAMQSNGKLGNKSGRRTFSDTYVEGFLNDTKANVRSLGIRSFRDALGIEKPCLVANNTEYFKDRYSILGPYDVPLLGRGTPKRINQQGFDDLFGSISSFPLADSAGIYVITALNGNSMKPIYIGNLNGSRTAKDIHENRLRTFADIRIDERKMSKNVRSTRGYFKIFFLPRIRSEGTPAKPSPKSEEFLLELLMLYGMMANPQIRSSDPTSQFLNGLYLEGWLNKGIGDNRRKPVRELKSILGQ